MFRTVSILLLIFTDNFVEDNFVFATLPPLLSLLRKKLKFFEIDKLETIWGCNLIAFCALSLLFFSTNQVWIWVRSEWCVDVFCYGLIRMVRVTRPKYYRKTHTLKVSTSDENKGVSPFSKFPPAIHLPFTWTSNSPG